MHTKIHTSKTRINRKLERKTNSELAGTITEAKKSKSWLEVANLVSRPRRQRVSKNLDELDKIGKEGDTIVVPGKVLGGGDVSKKLRIVALSFSEEARKKLKDGKCEIVTVKEEIKLNPKAQGLKVIK